MNGNIASTYIVEGTRLPLRFGLSLRKIQRRSIIQDKQKRPFFLIGLVFIRMWRSNIAQITYIAQSKKCHTVKPQTIIKSPIKPFCSGFHFN